LTVVYGQCEERSELLIIAVLHYTLLPHALSLIDVSYTVASADLCILATPAADNPKL